MRSLLSAGLAAVLLAAVVAGYAVAAPEPHRYVVQLEPGATAAVVAGRGEIIHDLPGFGLVVISATPSDAESLAREPGVRAVARDEAVDTGPVELHSGSVPLSELTAGLSTWDLDAIDVTAGPGSGTRAVAETGAGVYVAVLDTGLVENWRDYFPAERVLTQYGQAFVGANAGSPENQWEHDTHGHGTHVTSTILGFMLNAYEDGKVVASVAVAGVAPGAWVIPVKVLNQNGSGFWGDILAGWHYVTFDLASLRPMVVNMSLGGGASPALQAIMQAATDAAYSRGVLMVASAGNSGYGGQGVPARLNRMIAAAATGWSGHATLDADGNLVFDRTFWYKKDVPEGAAGVDQQYPAYFTTRDMEKNRPCPADSYNAPLVCVQYVDHDADDPAAHVTVAAPGRYILGPFLAFGGAHPPTSTGQSGVGQYYFLSGTSMAAPHVTGVVALLLERNPGLGQDDARAILEATARPWSEPLSPADAPHQQFEPLRGASTAYWANVWEVGAGHLDADAALDAARGGKLRGRSGR